MKKLTVWLALGSLILMPQATLAQETEERVVTLLHAAPGKYREVVQWLADNDRVRAEAGLEPRQIYRHRNGGNWDFLVIEPPLVADEDAKFEAAAEKLGITLAEFRDIVMDHEDTIVGGPTTGARVMAELD
jgi:hypothetical protein